VIRRQPGFRVEWLRRNSALRSRTESWTGAAVATAPRRARTTVEKRILEVETSDIGKLEQIKVWLKYAGINLTVVLMKRKSAN